MRLRVACLLCGAIALAQPPVPASAHMLTIPACGGGKVRHMALPRDPTVPAEEKDCVKACHAVTERRSKHRADTGRCCG